MNSDKTKRIIIETAEICLPQIGAHFYKCENGKVRILQADDHGSDRAARVDMMVEYLCDHLCAECGKLGIVHERDGSKRNLCHVCAKPLGYLPEQYFREERWGLGSPSSTVVAEVTKSHPKLSILAEILFRHVWSAAGAMITKFNVKLNGKLDFEWVAMEDRVIPYDVREMMEPRINALRLVASELSNRI
jgi:hypothetical protein